LILARDVLGPRTVLLGANRDERAERASSPPQLLRGRPRVVGGKDEVAGGTWLAIREAKAAVALLNRRDPDAHEPPPGRRSRGQLTLEVATALPEPGLSATADGADDDEARAALATALRSIERERYAPFTLVYASPTSCWMLALEGGEPRIARIDPGWHVLTHRDMDDPGEPRTAHLLAGLRGLRPSSRAEAEGWLMERLRAHGDDGSPAVCLHQGVMVTVSSSLVWIDEAGARYLHAEGRPCERPYEDRSTLLQAIAQPDAAR
jgi:hypothetical protein